MSNKPSILNNKIINCQRCSRLAQYRQKVAKTRRRAFQSQTYWGKPLPGFGKPDAKIWIVGLAPGAHGANRTGRVFTGDSSGGFLFSALYRASLANQSVSVGFQDGLEVLDCYISCAVRCVPPENRPTPRERLACRSYLHEELKILKNVKVILSLGKIAFEEIGHIFNLSSAKFGHGVQLNHEGYHIIGSYHVSRQNTQTGRLTQQMFDNILLRTKQLAGYAPL